MTNITLYQSRQNDEPSSGMQRYAGSDSGRNNLLVIQMSDFEPNQPSNNMYGYQGSNRGCNCSCGFNGGSQSFGGFPGMYQNQDFGSFPGMYSGSGNSAGIGGYQNPNMGFGSFAAMNPYQNPYMGQSMSLSQIMTQCVSLLANLTNMLVSTMSRNNPSGFCGSGGSSGYPGTGSTAGLSGGSSYPSGCGTSSGSSYPSTGGTSGRSGLGLSGGSSCPPTGTTTGTTGAGGTFNPRGGKGLMNTSVLPQSAKTQELKGRFDQIFPEKNALQNASDKDVNGMYNEYISCDSLVKMYRATGDKKYIQKACQLANAYIDTGKDMDGDGYKDWKAKDIPQNMNHDHYEWRAADGVAELTNQIMSDPKLKQEFGGQGQKFGQFIEKDVWQKWNNKVGRCGAINKVPSEQHFIARIGKIALNMYNCTKDPKYKSWLDKNVPKLQQAIAKTGDIGGTIKGGSMDSGHAADTADFVSECYKAGLYFTKNDMQRLAQAAKKRGLPPGFVKLAQFDQSLYQAYLSKAGSAKSRDGANVVANLAAIGAEGIM